MVFKPAYLAAFLISLAGCGRSEFAPLRGTITLDGKPLPTANITFFNDSDGPNGYGHVESDGGYFAKTGGQAGLKPGKYRISAVAYQPEVIVNRAIAKIPKPITPAKYINPDTSGFSYTLTDAGGRYDIELKSH